MLDRIARNPNYADEYKTRLRSAYSFFKDNGYEFTEHALGRALGPKTGKGKQIYTLNDILSVLRKGVNYRDGDAKLIRYYDSLAVIQANDTGEIVTIISTKRPGASWEEI